MPTAADRFSAAWPREFAAMVTSPVMTSVSQTRCLSTSAARLAGRDLPLAGHVQPVRDREVVGPPSFLLHLGHERVQSLAELRGGLRAARRVDARRDLVRDDPALGSKLERRQRSRLGRDAGDEARADLGGVGPERSQRVIGLCDAGGERHDEGCEKRFDHAE